MTTSVAATPLDGEIMALLAGEIALPFVLAVALVIAIVMIERRHDGD